MEHEFTKVIKDILKNNFGDKIAEKIFDKSDLLKYINIKTRSANKGSKARSSFANLYALFVLIEDYLTKNFDKNNKYEKYEGAKFTDLFKRQRELPFGSKLQNHALNHRLNEEFKKYFPTCPYIPIIRDTKTNRYWIHEKLIKFKINDKKHNLGNTIIEIINEYIKTKKESFEKFIKFCKSAKNLNENELITFIKDLLKPTIDARIFEIVSYCILKYYYIDKKIYWGFEKTKIKKDNLKLFKTGRTNANDGGIDFVMTPLGKFFQVTETMDVKKYFLDIDKIERFPLTFIIKSKESEGDIRKKLEKQAKETYSIDEIVKKFMQCIDEIINIDKLIEYLKKAIKKGYLKNILNELILQSKVEFNYEDEIESNEIIENIDNDSDSYSYEDL